MATTDFIDFLRKLNSFFLNSLIKLSNLKKTYFATFTSSPNTRSCQIQVLTIFLHANPKCDQLINYPALESSFIYFSNREFIKGQIGLCKGISCNYDTAHRYYEDNCYSIYCAAQSTMIISGTQLTSLHSAASPKVVIQVVLKQQRPNLKALNFF